MRNDYLSKGLARVFVADAFHEQQNEDVIFELAGSHSVPQFFTGQPEGGVEIGFF